MSSATQTPSLYVIVPGFGAPHIAHKAQILESNIKRIRTFPWSRFHMQICSYATPQAIIPHITSEYFYSPYISWVFEPGIVGQYIHKYATPEAISGFDYVLVILDDIELQSDIDFAKILAYDRFFHLDMYSPTLTTDSKYQFQYMLTSPASGFHVKVTCACEAFCYFIPQRTYAQYYRLIEPDTNPWLWGVDTCLWKCFGVRVGMFNFMTVKHHYKNECYSVRPDADPFEGRRKLFERLGVTEEELANQSAVLYYIFATDAMAPVQTP